MAVSIQLARLTINLTIKTALLFSLNTSTRRRRRRIDRFANSRLPSEGWMNFPLSLSNSVVNHQCKSNNKQTNKQTDKQTDVHGGSASCVTELCSVLGAATTNSRKSPRRKSLSYLWSQFATFAQHGAAAAAKAPTATAKTAQPSAKGMDPTKAKLPLLNSLISYNSLGG